MYDEVKNKKKLTYSIRTIFQFYQKLWYMNIELRPFTEFFKNVQ